MKKTLLYRILRNSYAVLTGRHVSIKENITLPHVWYGSDYGGFYVHPDVLTKNSIVYSFGIGHDVTFDEEIIRRHGCQVFGFDPTPKSIEWLKSKSLPGEFSFYAYGIGKKTEDRDFFLPQNPEHVSGSILPTKTVDPKSRVKISLKSFDDITRELNHRRIDVLKMDIEGAEYEVLPSLLASPTKSIQILLEFHHRMVPNGKQLSENAIALLKTHGYGVFGVSANGDEVSFINMDYLSSVQG